jgi:hypothetical protein
MLNAYHLPPLGLAAFLAVALGIQLGESTVDSIKPTFFQGPAVHPRERGAALDPRELEARRLARQAAAYREHYSWNDGEMALRLACANCGPAVSRAYLYNPAVPYFGSREEIAAEDARMRQEIDARYEARLEAEEERRARFALVERYAHPEEEVAEGMGGPEEPVEDMEEALVEVAPIPED